jgi:predicted ATPase
MGACLPYGEGITFWPIAEALRAAAGVEDEHSPGVAHGKMALLLDGEEGAADILERLGPALGITGPRAALEETFWAIRKLLEALARRQPLMVVLDDVHWAEETLLDLIEYLAGWTRGVPLLLVCATRPELPRKATIRRQPTRQREYALLEPLAADSADELMLWQLDACLARARERILTASEAIRCSSRSSCMLIDDGLIVRRNGSWQATGEVRSLAMPPTIQALWPLARPTRRCRARPATSRRRRTRLHGARASF